MPAKAALSMSQTKEDLLKYLGMGLDTYAIMAKETDAVYKWLTTGTQHLKSNCTRDPPYDWSDITELSKEAAMIRLAHSGDAHTSYYWKLADQMTTDGCPNWIARWFLYHKFRYRDGRNRGKDTKSTSRRKHGSGGKGRTKSYGSADRSPYDISQVIGMVGPASSEYSSYGIKSQDSSSSKQSISSDSSYSSAGIYSPVSTSAPSSSANFYDPVKGYWRPKD